MGRRHRWISLATVIALVAAMAVVGAVVTPAPAEAAVRDPFTAVYNAQENGAIALTGNSQMSCPTSATCTTARGGTGNSANLNKVALRVPGGTYSTVTGTVFDPGLNTGTDTDTGPYQGSLDITTQVKAAGNGTYWVGNIAAGTGVDRYAGWSLVVAYRNPAAPLRDLRIFRGFADVTSTTGNENVDIPISGFLAPAAGAVNASVGVVAWEGDKGITGEGVKLNGTTLSSATNPATKTVDADEVAPGGLIGWTVAVTNTGPGTARNVALLDTLPAGVTLSSTELSGATGSCSGDPAVLCVLDDLAADRTAELLITATVDPSTQGQLTNAASATSPDDADPQNNTAQAIATVVAAADLSVVKTVSGDPPVAGGTVEWTIEVGNAGPAVAPGVVVTDPLPAGVAEPVLPPDCSLLTGTITCAVGELAVGGTATRVISATVDPTARGVLTKTASVTATPLDVDPANNTSTATAPIGVQGTLTLTKTADAEQVAIDAPVTYTVTVSNTGPSAALGVSVTEQLPDGGAVGSAEVSQGTYDADGNLWNVGSVTAGVPAVLTITLSFPVAGDAVNTVVASTADAPQTISAQAAVRVNSDEPTPPPGPEPPLPPSPIPPAPNPPAPNPEPGAPALVSGGAMPNTGFAADRIAVAALGLLLVGFTLIALGRRGRRTGRSG